MKKYIWGIGLLCTLIACHPEDRSNEQPFAPTVRTLTTEVQGNVCLMTGQIDASPNSRIRKRGFKYGNDTLRLEVVSEIETDLFQAYTEELLPGEYFMVAYATNGVGTSMGDTLRFQIR